MADYDKVGLLAIRNGRVLLCRKKHTTTALILPGAAGHAGQTPPRGLTVAFDWLHLASGSLWLGGLVGLLVLGAWMPRERRCLTSGRR